MHFPFGLPRSTYLNTFISSHFYTQVPRRIHSRIRTPSSPAWLGPPRPGSSSSCRSSCSCQYMSKTHSATPLGNRIPMLSRIIIGFSERQLSDRLRLWLWLVLRLRLWLWRGWDVVPAIASAIMTKVIEGILWAIEPATATEPQLQPQPQP